MCKVSDSQNLHVTNQNYTTMHTQSKRVIFLNIHFTADMSIANLYSDLLSIYALNNQHLVNPIILTRQNTCKTKVLQFIELIYQISYSEVFTYQSFIISLDSLFLSVSYQGHSCHSPTFDNTL